jgi:hypothetical protein
VRIVFRQCCHHALKSSDLRGVDSGCALSSVEEHFLHTEGAAGSSPAARTIPARLRVRPRNGPIRDWLPRATLPVKVLPSRFHVAYATWNRDLLRAIEQRRLTGLDKILAETLHRAIQHRQRPANCHNCQHQSRTYPTLSRRPCARVSGVARGAAPGENYSYKPAAKSGSPK